MTGRIVIGCYRPKPGQEAAFLALLKQDAPLLRAEGFLTDYPVAILHSPTDGAWLQIAQWVSEDAADRAHQNERIMAHWDRLAQTADYLSLAELEKAQEPFPQFELKPNFFDHW
jgi:quinol monooxygenase YgiN